MVKRDNGGFGKQNNGFLKMFTFHSQKFLTILPYMTKGLCSCGWLTILDRESILDLSGWAQCNQKSPNKSKREWGRRGRKRDMRIEAKV